MSDLTTGVALALLLTASSPGLAQSSRPALAAAVVHSEDGDAESFPDGTPQITVGSGLLTSIEGSTGAGDLRDAFCIRIDDPQNFVASTDPRGPVAGSGNFDTRLLLFDHGGAPILAAEDAPPAKDPYLSRLLGAASDGSGFALPGAGSYILVVASFPDEPRDALDVNLFDMASDFEAVHAANPAAGPFDHWSEEGPTGDYVVALRGVKPCSPFATVPQGEQFPVNADTLSALSSRISHARDGSSVIVFRGDSEDTDADASVQARRYDASGQAVGAQFQVNTFTTGIQSVPDISHAPDGTFVVVWQSTVVSGYDATYSIRAQRHGADGLPSGGELQVNTYGTIIERKPAVSQATDGGFVVVWESYESGGTDSMSIQGRRFDAGGAPQGSQFQVNSYTTYSQNAAAISHAPDGSFVVAWSSFSGSAGDDTAFDSVQLQRFDAGGNPSGVQLQVNSYTTGNQTQPQISHGPDGSFVVVWYGQGLEDQDQSGIQGQLYDDAGVAVGGEFQVNSATTGVQSHHRIGRLGDGSFVVVWRSQVDGNVFSLHGRRFEASGSPISGDFDLPAAEDAIYYSDPDVSGDLDGSFTATWLVQTLATVDVRAQRFGVDSDGDAIADPIDSCPAQPDPDCLSLDSFECGQTSFWSDAVP